MTMLNMPRLIQGRLVKASEGILSSRGEPKRQKGSLNRKMNIKIEILPIGYVRNERETLEDDYSGGIISQIVLNDDIPEELFALSFFFV
jgi:hypothetical protein